MPAFQKVNPHENHETKPVRPNTKSIKNPNKVPIKSKKTLLKNPPSKFLQNPFQKKNSLEKTPGFLPQATIVDQRVLRSLHEDRGISIQGPVAGRGHAVRHHVGGPRGRKTQALQLETGPGPGQVAGREKRWTSWG